MWLNSMLSVMISSPVALWYKVTNPQGKPLAIPSVWTHLGRLNVKKIKVAWLPP